MRSFVTKPSSERRLKLGPYERSRFGSTCCNFLKIHSSRLTWNTQEGYWRRERRHKGIMGTKTQAEVERAPAAPVLRLRPWQQPSPGEPVTERRLWVTVSQNTPAQERRSSGGTNFDFPPVSGCRNGKHPYDRRARIWLRSKHITESCVIYSRGSDESSRGEGYGWGTCSRWPVNNIRWAVSLPDELPENGEVLRVERF